MVNNVKSFYTDLIDEKIAVSKIGGIGKQIKTGKFGLEKLEFKVTKDNEKELGKPCGNYITINCSKLLAHLTEVQDYVATEIAFSLRKLLLKSTGKKNPFVLVVGLGNQSMVADSLGALVVKDLLITHSIPELARTELGDLAAFIPGVGGCTGLATYDIIMGVCQRVKPDIIIAIDTLTANDSKRLGCSFQMCDAGIKPGAGVGNDTKILNQTTINIPTIALGVPMMISGFGLCEKIENNLKDKIFAPKEVDIFINKCARTISIAINLAIHGKVYKDYC